MSEGDLVDFVDLFLLCDSFDGSKATGLGGHSIIRLSTE